MRILIKAFFVFACCLQVFSASAFAEGASRQETIDWLRAKLTNYTYTVTLSMQSPSFYSYEIRTSTVVYFAVDKDNNMTLRFRGTNKGNVGGRDRDNTVDANYVIALNSLTAHCVPVPASFGPALTVENPGWLVPLNSAPGRVMTDAANKSTVTGVNIGINDAELATRVSKAFEHLIILAGGKNEAF